MRFVFFCHAFTSCWNNGNAHFLRGVARELLRMKHTVAVFEPAHGWSRMNALADDGASALEEAEHLIPGVQIKKYAPETLDLDEALDRADVVLVHEWNAPALVAAIGERRKRAARFQLLFHDTHHRAVTAPHEMARFDLDGYDGVLAFGEILRDIYVKRGWTRRAFVWHEAADTALFRPDSGAPKNCDLIWIGNWGDNERSRELHEFLIAPSTLLNLRTHVHGVRYPEGARRVLQQNGLQYCGWLPNQRVPQAFARAKATIHVPRGPYVRALPGIPTIRMFEALACGVPLISAPWLDVGQLFPEDCYLQVATTDETVRALRRILADPDLARHLVTTGLRTIHARHTCAHRARELLAIVDHNTKQSPPGLADVERVA